MKSHTPLPLFLLSLLLSATAVVAQNATEPPTLEGLLAQIESARKEAKVPAVSLAIVSRDRVIYAGALGVANLATNRPATPETLFRVGSVSKGVVGIAAMIAHERYGLDLNKRLRDLAPELPYKNPWESTDPVRLIHLLTHTSGFDETHFRDFAKADQRRNNLLDAINYTPAWRECRWRPGTMFSYTNGGTAVAAYIVEKQVRMEFEDFAQRDFFDEVGMKTATYFPPKNGVEIAESYFVGTIPFGYWHFPMRPTGSLNLSAHDMAAYVRFHLNRGRAEPGGKVIISEDGMRKIEASGPSFSTQAGLESYGMFNRATMDIPGRRWYGHDGDLPGVTATFNYQIDIGIGYAIAFNTSNWPFRNKVRELISDYLLGASSAKPELPPVAIVPDEKSKEFSGTYVLASPRSRVMAPLDRLTWVRTLSFDGERSFWRPLFGAGSGHPGPFVAMSPFLWRAETQALPTLAFARDNQSGDHLVATSYHTYRKTNPAVAFAPHFVVALALLAMLVSSLSVPVTLVQAALGKSDWWQTATFRLWPVAVTIPFVTLPLWLRSLTAVPNVEAIKYLNGPTLVSVGVTTLSLAIPVLAFWGLYRCIRQNPGPTHRALRIFALVTLGSMSGLALLCILSGAFPIILWR